MNEIYEYVDTIYESLVDRDFDELSAALKDLMEELKEIQLSISDEL